MPVQTAHPDNPKRRPVIMAAGPTKRRSTGRYVVPPIDRLVQDVRVSAAKTFDFRGQPLARPCDRCISTPIPQLFAMRDRVGHAALVASSTPSPIGSAPRGGNPNAH
jgi:hypothetical protein